MAGGTLLLVLLNDAAPLAASQLGVTVGNSGDADIIVGNIDMTGDTAAFTIVDDPVSGATLAPGAALQIVVEAVTDVAGTYLATLRIPSSDDDGSLTVALLSRVIAVAAVVPGMSVDPTGTVAFGSVDTATGSAVQVFTVSSTGTDDLVCGTVAIGGAGAASWSKSADGVSGVTIPAGESRSVTLTFNPSSDGAKTATLTFPAAGVTSVVVSMTGTGTTGAPPPSPTTVNRFYFTRQEDAAFAITTAPSQTWQVIAVDPNWVLAPEKGGPAVTYGDTIPHDGVSGHRTRFGLWVSPPLEAQTVTTDYVAYAIGYRSSALGSNVTSALRFALWRAADSTIEWQSIQSMGTAVSPWPDSSNPLPRRFPAGDPFSWSVTLDIEDGDRLIVELGFRAFSTSHNGARIRWGGSSTASDLENTQTAQSLTLAPWIEFTSGLSVKP